MITDGVAALPPEMQQAVFAAVKTFEAFDCPNDPYGEHDFGSVAISGTAVFWKIDAYDREMQFGSEDPSDPAQTTRVLTIMLAQEY